MKSFLKITGIIIAIFIVSILSQIAIQASNEGPYDIIYFGSEGCLSCQEIEGDGTLESLEEQGYTVIRYTIKFGQTDVNQLHRNYIYTYDVPDHVIKTPIIFVGHQYFSGVQSIRSNVNNGTIQSIADSTDLLQLQDAPYMEYTFTDIMKNLGITMFMGLGDAFNICAISMLLMFISFLATTHNKKAIALICVSYVTAVFLTYFMIGLLIRTLLSSLVQYTLVFAWIIFIIATLLMLLNLYDYIQVRRRKYEKVKNQLPKGIFKFAKRMMDGFSKKIDDGHKSIYVIAFIIGVVVALVEFPCTGQVYLVWLDQITRNIYNPSIFYIFLMFYNILFVSPLIVITIIALRTQSIHGVSNFMRQRMDLIKLLNVLIFLFVMIYYFFIIF